MQGVEIIASGGLDEYKIEKLVQGNAPIDCFAVGTAMGVSSDAPALDVAYKLTEYAGEGRLKRSSGKATLPGRKQVFRNEEGGRFAGDEIARYYEERPGRTLLRCVMKAGQRTLEGSELLRMAHSRAQDELARIPPALYSLAPCPEPYPVAISTELTEHERNVRRKINMQQGLP
jgi:nicotinate phosphoribosyltransferase